MICDSSVHHLMMRFFLAILSQCWFISYRIFFVITHFWIALIAFLFFFWNTHFKLLRSVLVQSCMLPTRSIRRWMHIFILMVFQVKLRHMNKFIFTWIGWGSVSIELLITSLPHLVHFLNVRQILFLCINIALFVDDNQIVENFSITPKFVLLDLKLILLNQF